MIIQGNKGAFLFTFQATNESGVLQFRPSLLRHSRLLLQLLQRFKSQYPPSGKHLHAWFLVTQHVLTVQYARLDDLDMGKKPRLTPRNDLTHVDSMYVHRNNGVRISSVLVMKMRKEARTWIILDHGIINSSVLFYLAMSASILHEFF